MCVQRGSNSRYQYSSYRRKDGRQSRLTARLEIWTLPFFLVVRFLQMNCAALRFVGWLYPRVNPCICTWPVNMHVGSFGVTLHGVSHPRRETSSELIPMASIKASLAPHRPRLILA